MHHKFRKPLLLGNLLPGLMALSAKADGAKPAISTQPAAPLTRAVETSPSRTVATSGTGPPCYQWRKDGPPVGVTCHGVVNGRRGTAGTAVRRSTHGPSAGPAAAGGPAVSGTGWSRAGAGWRISGLALPLLGEDHGSGRRA